MVLVVVVVKEDGWVPTKNGSPRDRGQEMSQKNSLEFTARISECLKMTIVPWATTTNVCTVLVQRRIATQAIDKVTWQKMASCQSIEEVEFTVC